MMVIANLLGGMMSCRPPPSLKNIHYACLKCYASNKATSDDASCRQSSCHDPLGIFQGKSYKDFKDPTLRVGAVRLHGE